MMPILGSSHATEPSRAWSTADRWIGRRCGLRRVGWVARYPLPVHRVIDCFGILGEFPHLSRVFLCRPMLDNAGQTDSLATIPPIKPLRHSVPPRESPHPVSIFWINL
jgi:hypothetical protein